MSKMRWLVVLVLAVAMMASAAVVCFAEGYTYIDSNAGGVNVELTNTDDPSDGPKISTVLADAKKIFPAWIKEKNVPAVKTYYVKSANELRIRAASWQPIDRIDYSLIGVTKPVDNSGNYYLYNAELRYTRSIGSKKWVVDKGGNGTSITLGTGQPGDNGIHLINANNEDLTLKESIERQKREAEEYERQQEEYNKKNDKKKRAPAEERSETPPDDGTGSGSGSDVEKLIPSFKF
ncbi:MAG: hypothetical protein WC838_01055 [Candidatus Margulisiibacteriota bacterium]|jgi:hypothetical protein